MEERWFNHIYDINKKSMPMLKVYRDGEFKFSVELKDLIRDFQNLEKIDFYFSLGRFSGI